MFTGKYDFRRRLVEVPTTKVEKKILTEVPEVKEDSEKEVLVEEVVEAIKEPVVEETKVEEVVEAPKKKTTRKKKAE